MTDRLTPELFDAGIAAMNGLKAIQDRMLPLIEEVNYIIADGIVRLKALELVEAIQRRDR